MDFDGDDEQSAFDSSSHASLLDSPSFVSFSSASQAGSQQYEDTKVQAKVSFFNDWEKGVSGTITSKGVKHILNDFAMKLLYIAEAGTNTGYFVLVKREQDAEENLSRECFFTASSLNAKNKFIDQINYSFGPGAMSCGFESNNHVAFFVQFLKRNVQGGLQTKKAVMVSGQQQSGIFAMNSKCFLDSNGEEVAEVSNPHVWLKRESIMESDKIMMDDVTAVVRKPLSLSSAVDFFLNLKKCLNHNLIPGLLVVSGAVMSFHYRTVIDKYGGCAVTVATGESGTGKSTAIKAALALFGCAHNGICSKGTNAGMLERSSRSTLPYGIDDPTKSRGSRSNQLDLGELCIDLYNGQKTINLRSGARKPFSIPIVATNFGADEMDRVLSRVLLIPFELPSCGPVTAEECTVYGDFQRACESGKYSSLVGWIIRQGKTMLESGEERIQEIREDLQGSESHSMVSRNVLSWAISFYFLEKFINMVYESDTNELQKEEDGDEECNKAECVSTIVAEAMHFIVHKASKRVQSTTAKSQTSCSASSFFETVQSICLVTATLQKHEVLAFMRSSTLERRPVVVMWMSRVNELVHIDEDFSLTIRRLKLGRGGIKRPLLKLGCTDTAFQPNKNTVRRSCLAIFVDDKRWPPKLVKQLKIAVTTTPTTPAVAATVHVNTTPVVSSVTTPAVSSVTTPAVAATVHVITTPAVSSITTPAVAATVHVITTPAVFSVTTPAVSSVTTPAVAATVHANTTPVVSSVTTPAVSSVTTPAVAATVHVNTTPVVSSVTTSAVATPLPSDVIISPSSTSAVATPLPSDVIISPSSSAKLGKHSRELALHDSLSDFFHPKSTTRDRVKRKL